MNYIYYLNNLNISNNIPNVETIYICLYTIIDNNILYLLHNENNIMIFPHFTPKLNIKLESDILIKNKMLLNPEYKGWLLKDKSVYLFYNLFDNFNYNKYDNNFIFASIYEIIFSKKIFNVKIHSEVSSIFYKYRLLSYLYDLDDNQLEIKEVVYYKCSKSNLKFITEIGIVNNYSDNIKINNINSLNDLAVLLREYLIINNISINKFINSITGEEELTLNNLYKFITDKGIMCNRTILKNLIKKLDLNNNKKLSENEISSIFLYRHFEGINLLINNNNFITAFNKDFFDKGSYVRIIVNLYNYNVVKVSNNNSRILKITDPYLILSGNTI